MKMTCFYVHLLLDILLQSRNRASVNASYRASVRSWRVSTARTSCVLSNPKSELHNRVISTVILSHTPSVAF